MNQAIGYLFKRAVIPQAHSLLRWCLWISVMGMALGVALLVVVLAVMSGFDSYLTKSYLRLTSHAVVVPYLQNTKHQLSELHEKIKSYPEAERVAPFLISQAMLVGKTSSGVFLEGIDPKQTMSLFNWNEVWVKKPADESLDLPNWIWLGKPLAEKLGVDVGSKINLLIVFGNKRQTHEFIVTAISHFGIYDRDLHDVRVPITKLGKITGVKSQSSSYRIKLNEGVNTLVFEEKIKKDLASLAHVQMWYDLNRNIFLAIRHQKSLLFLVLEILVGLSIINVVNLLLMHAEIFRRDLAILRAIGMKRSSVGLLFVLEGAWVGFLGVVSGILLGGGMLIILKAWQPKLLNEAVYNTSTLPLEIRFYDVLAIAVVGFLLCILFSLFPAWRVARMMPAEVLKGEQGAV